MSATIVQSNFSEMQRAYLCKNFACILVFDTMRSELSGQSAFLDILRFTVMSKERFDDSLLLSDFDHGTVLYQGYLYPIKSQFYVGQGSEFEMAIRMHTGLPSEMCLYCIGISP
jgi:hypothetical protein